MADFDSIVKDRLAEMLGARIIARINKDNPKCQGCGRHDNPESIVYAVVFEDRKFLVCPDCSDQDLYNKTGCYFGLYKCNHSADPICTGPKKLLLFQKK